MATVQITPQMVKKLREESGAGMMDCKTALGDTDGDHDAALKILREKGIAAAGKLAGRATTEGRIEVYNHGGRIGVMVEVGCNTDFVARNDEFVEFCKDLAMHIAAMAPQWVTRDEVPAEIIESERQIYIAQAEDKPENVRAKIAEGKLEKWFSDVVLLEQSWVRGKEKFDKETTIEELRQHVSSSMGENIEIRRFIRYVIGES